MIPPDARRASPASAVAEAGWGGGAAVPPPQAGGFAAAGPARSPRPWTLAAPVPAALLAAAVALLDVAAVTLSGLALGTLALSGGRPEVGAILLGGLMLPCLTALGGGYEHPSLFGGRRAVHVALGALAASCGGLCLAALALCTSSALPAGIAGLWLLLAAPLLVSGRLAAAAVLRGSADRARRRAVVVGDGVQASRLVAALRDRPDRSLRLLGVVDDRAGAADGGGRGRCGLPHLGGLDSLFGMIRDGELDEVVLALPWAAETRVEGLVSLLRDHPVEVRLAPEVTAYPGGRPMPVEAGRLQLPLLVERPIGGVAGLVKAAEDYALALAALTVAAVPMALIALAIRLDSPGPVLFRQRRTGFNNREFHVLKFRTMYHNAADPGVVRQVTEGDPRVTRVGAVLRRTSLDELPQILNVLRGEMSFVGPRPHAPGTQAGGRPFEQVVERYAARHRVKPGLTGLAQVRGWRGPTETEEKLIRRVESDLEYIENWSLWLDFVILVRTLLAVARMRNAC
jgi:polysaccharide biosynthesis protein PslA